MSKLIVTSRTGSAVNSEFEAWFLRLAESHECCLPTSKLSQVNALLDTNTEERAAENRDLQSMAQFMLMTGTYVAYKDDDMYYFGGADVMNHIEEFMTDGKLLVLQYAHEVKKKLDLADVLLLFRKINADLPEQERVPLTDESYYTTQLLNLYEHEMGYAEAEDLAGKMHDFIEFQATGRDVDNVSDYNDDYDNPGRIYEDGAFWIGSTKTWPAELHENHAWYLRICNEEYLSNNLEELELKLFKFAQFSK